MRRVLVNVMGTPGETPRVTMSVMSVLTPVLTPVLAPVCTNVYMRRCGTVVVASGISDVLGFPGCVRRSVCGWLRRKRCVRYSVMRGVDV